MLFRSPGTPLLVIGADTVVSLDGQILEKPKDRSDARRMLEKISGRVHQVYTGVSTLFIPEECSREFTECTEVEVAPLAKEDIESYLDSGEPFDKAGAYGIQGLFARYVRGIRGDYNNVVGLPVGRLYRECLKDFIGR